MNLEERLRNSIKRWTSKAAAFEHRSLTVEGPMDDVLIAKAGELRSCAMELEELLPKDQEQSIVLHQQNAVASRRGIRHIDHVESENRMKARQTKHEKRMDFIASIVRQEDPTLLRWQSAEIAEYLIKRYGDKAEDMAGMPYTMSDGSKNW